MQYFRSGYLKKWLCATYTVAVQKFFHSDDQEMVAQSPTSYHDGQSVSSLFVSCNVKPHRQIQTDDYQQNTSTCQVLSQ